MRGDSLPKLVTPVPGPKSKRLARELRRYESRNVVTTSDEFPIFWERASGANVWDVDGNRYIDLTAGFGVANAGHCNARLVAAAQKQAAKLLHGLGDVHPSELRFRLARELSKLTFERWGAGRGKVLFGSSGSEAVELALKTAAIATGKPGVLAFEGGYHGLTYGALDGTWSAHYRRPFSQQLGHFTIHVPFPRENIVAAVPSRSHHPITPSPQRPTAAEVLERMSKAVRHSSIGAVLVEPIQGRAGIIVPPPDFLPMVRSFCDKHGLLLIADELYAGFGRTGKWFAVEHFQNALPLQRSDASRSLIPDLICVGKGMAGGFPISACIGKASVMDAWPESQGDPIHTSTFFGNPLGCAMALAQIEEIREKKLVARSWQLGKELHSALSIQHSASACVGEIRGRGMMIGVEIVKRGAKSVEREMKPDAFRAFDIVVRAMQRGLILTADGIHHNILTLTPPLTIREQQLDYTIETLSVVAR